VEAGCCIYYVCTASLENGAPIHCTPLPWPLTSLGLHSELPTEGRNECAPRTPTLGADCGLSYQIPCMFFAFILHSALGVCMMYIVPSKATRSF
jgi:hypothetical protein